MPVGSQRYVDGQPLASRLRKLNKVVHGIRDAGGIVEGLAPFKILFRQRNQDTCNWRTTAHAAVAGGNAGNVRSMRSLRQLRLLLDFMRGDANLWGSLDCRVQVSLQELGPIGELLLSRMRPSTAALIPDRDKTRLAFAVEEVGVREIEALNINDADQHLFAETMVSFLSELTRGR